MLHSAKLMLKQGLSITGYLCSIFKLLEAAKDGLLLLSYILPCVVYC